jgi:hypothetical protein
MARILGTGAKDDLRNDRDIDWDRVMSARAVTEYKGWLCAQVPGGDVDHIRAVAQQLSTIRRHADSPRRA